MRNIVVATYCLSGIFLFASCGSDNNQVEEAEVKTEATGTPVIGSNSTLTDEQRQLFDRIARHNQLQLELGKLATERGINDAIKQYGQKMVDLHTKRQQELQAMVQTYGVILQQDINDDFRNDVEDVTKAEQGKFEEKYWNNVIESQEDLLEEFDSVLKHVNETEGSSFHIWAQSSMKELRAQMEQAMANRLQLRTNQ